MSFAAQTFTLSQVLTSTQMNQVDSNIDAVRNSHKGSSAPGDLVAGVQWIDDSSSPWTLKMYDGADWISIGTIDASGNLFTPTFPTGTWSPVLSDGTNNATMQNTAACYTKIGNRVFISGKLSVLSLGSVSGAVRVTGLPYTSSNVTNQDAAVAISDVTCDSGVSAGQSISARIVPNANFIYLYLNDIAGGDSALQASESTFLTFSFSGHYVTG